MSWRTQARSFPARTRPCRLWSATRRVWTRSPARYQHWRSKTWSPSATSLRCCGALRWSGESRKRSTAMSSSWAPTAAGQLLELEGEQAAVGAQLDDIAVDLFLDSPDHLKAPQHRSDVADGDQVFDLQC